MKLRVPYFQWRDGRPRWEPGPGLRARGFKGKDLKDEFGAWLPLGLAVERAKEMNVGAAALGTTVRPEAPVARTWGNLFTLFLDRDKFKKGSFRTLRTYRQHIRLMRPWCGDVQAHALKPADIEKLYFALIRERGLATANAVIRTLKAVAYFGRKNGWPIADPKTWLDEMEVPEGRLVLWEAAEIAAFVAWADHAGIEAQGDACVLGLMTGQRQGDVLALPELEDQAQHFKLVMRKTKRTAFVPKAALLASRIAKMRARKAERWPNVTFATELVDGAGKAYRQDGSQFGDEFRLVRALTAGMGETMVEIAAAVFHVRYEKSAGALATTPSIIEKRYADLRDTAITWLFAAECSIAEIANITGHSLKTVQTVLDKHYFVRNAAMAIAAGAKLDAWIARSGLTL